MSINNILLQYKNYRNEYIKSIKNEIGFKNKLKKMLPNILTKSRFVAPFIIVPIALSNLTTALIITIMFALTDAFDGYFARKYNAYSDYGRILDPICDKVFAIGVAIPILLINPLSIISTILLECGIAVINIKSSCKNNEPKSTYLGKLKTAILSISLIFGYLNITNLKITIFTNLIQLATAINYYNIDTKKDKIKKDKQSQVTINIDNQTEDKVLTYEYQNVYNSIEREKNELIELRKTFEKEEEQIDRQMTKA